MGRNKPATQEEAAVQQAAAPTAHSTLVGGSTAAMRLACPASYQLSAKLPATSKKGSSYADEGTALHGAMAYMIENDVLDAHEVEGMEFAGHDEEDGSAGVAYVMTKELIDEALAPALEFFDLQVTPYEDAIWLVEQRVEMPGIPGAFGTGDVIICIPSQRTTILDDWKFGVGVPVKAMYVGKDEEGEFEYPNPQLMFYGRAAMHSLPHMFGGTCWEDIPDDWRIELHIAQPRARTKSDDLAQATIERYTRAVTTKAELEEFRKALIRAVSEAKGAEKPKMQRGEHCRFAPCKAVCPLWLEPALDLTKALVAREERAGSALGDVWDYGAAYSAILALAHIVEPMLKEAEKQAHAFMEAGGKVPGWKLVDKKSSGRAWTKPDNEVVDELRRLGLPDNAIFKTEVRSPPQVEKDLLKINQNLPKGYFAPKPSSGTTLALEDDKRAEAIPLGVVVENFGKLLADLRPAE